jgi:hypothetical protein
VAKRNGNEREEVKCEPWASTEENFNGRFERKGSCRGGLLVGRKTYFLVAGIIFALVAVSHALGFIWNGQSRLRIGQYRNR